MIALFRNFKYKTDVIVQVHAILTGVPELSALLKSLTGLNKLIADFRKTGLSPLEAATYVSMLIIEQLTETIPIKVRRKVFDELAAPRAEGFIYFANILQKIKREDTSVSLDGQPLLAVALGHALWYLDYHNREGGLTSQALEIFKADVGGLLRGESPETRANNRATAALRQIISSDREDR